MKKILMILAVTALGLIILSVVLGRLEPLLGLLGIGGASTMLPYKQKAETAGKKAEEETREKLNKMSDKEVIDYAGKSDPTLNARLESIRKKYEWK